MRVFTHEIPVGELVRIGLHWRWREVRNVGVIRLLPTHVWVKRHPDEPVSAGVDYVVLLPLLLLLLELIRPLQLCCAGLQVFHSRARVRGGASGRARALTSIRLGCVCVCGSVRPGERVCGQVGLPLDEGSAHSVTPCWWELQVDFSSYVITCHTCGWIPALNRPACRCGVPNLVSHDVLPEVIKRSRYNPVNDLKKYIANHEYASINLIPVLLALGQSCNFTGRSWQ